jgi:hypothetical protein
MDNLIPLISNVGFPIVISLYVLMRLEKTLERNTSVIHELSLKLRTINK